MNYTQSPVPDIDTLKCPKCGWRSEGYYDYDLGGWTHEYEEELCPNQCKTRFGFRVKGKIVEQ